MYKIYNNGLDFLTENSDILRQNPLETLFFEVNARIMTQCNQENYALKVQNEKGFLIAIHYGNHPADLFGDASCCDELAQVFAANNLQFGSVLGTYDLCNSFLTAYEKIVGGTHQVKLEMQLMYCKKCSVTNCENVRWATAYDVEKLTPFYVDFLKAAVGDQLDVDSARKAVENFLSDTAVCEVDNEIVSMATIKNSNPARISNVYTLPSYRGKGYACKTVAFVTNFMLKKGFTPVLFVDQNNPISNHLYLKIGYTYSAPQYEITYRRSEK